jgi:hypothetical protein
MIDELKQNRIDKLRGLDKLTDLNCLSIGNNQITDLLASLQVSVSGTCVCLSYDCDCTQGGHDAQIDWQHCKHPSPWKR